MSTTLTNPRVIRIGVVDDHPIFTAPFASMLNKLDQFEATLVANSGRETLQLLEKQPEKPDIILMDIDMPDMNGIETARQITSMYPAIKIAALSGLNNEFAILQMFGAGACAFLSKNIDPPTLEQALQEIYRQGKYHADLNHLYVRNPLERYHRPMNITLKPKELEVLRCLRNGLSQEETSKTLLISLSLVKHYRAGLNQKFKTSSSIIVVVEAIRRGILPY